MSENDEDRVEYRLSTTGKLVNATPERIEDLMRLRAEREKLSRPRPAVSFDTVLATAQAGEGAPDPEAESLARSQVRRERAQAMARAGLQPVKAGREATATRAMTSTRAKASRPEPNVLPAAPPAREATVIRAAPVPKSEPKKGPPPKAPPRAGPSKRTIIKG